MLKKKLILIIFLIALMSLTGCMYPQERLAENNVPLETQISTVQDAVARYHKDTGVFPILNSEMDTPIYEKYILDMSKLYPAYMGYIPGNAFEKGGTNLYVLVNPETNPTVKLIDLKTSGIVARVQALVNEYQHNNGKYPLKDVIEEFAYTIDYSKLSMKTPEVESPFSGKNLELLITKNGEVFVDYRLDIGIYQNKHFTFTGEDAREILVQNSYYVPVKSYPYIWSNQEVKLSTNLRK